jgi:hypothetical protein
MTASQENIPLDLVASNVSTETLMMLTDVSAHQAMTISAKFIVTGNLHMAALVGFPGIAFTKEARLSVATLFGTGSDSTAATWLLDMAAQVTQADQVAHDSDEVAEVVGAPGGAANTPAVLALMEVALRLLDDTKVLLRQVAQRVSWLRSLPTAAETAQWMATHGRSLAIKMAKDQAQFQNRIPGLKGAPPPWWHQIFGSLERVEMALPMLQYEIHTAAEGREPAAWRVTAQQQEIVLYDVHSHETPVLAYSVSCFSSKSHGRNGIGLPWLPVALQSTRPHLRSEILWNSLDIAAGALDDYMHNYTFGNSTADNSAADGSNSLDGALPSMVAVAEEVVYADCLLVDMPYSLITGFWDVMSSGKMATISLERGAHAELHQETTILHTLIGNKRTLKTAQHVFKNRRYLAEEEEYACLGLENGA